MSKSAGGVPVYVLNVESNVVEKFATKSDACRYLGISIRTLSR